MTNNETKTFFYKTSRDAIIAVIAIIINIMLSLLSINVLAKLFCDYSTFTIALKCSTAFYISMPIWIFVFYDLSIDCNESNHLVIKTDEIVYYTAALYKKPISIPVNKIESCTKRAGPIQKLCHSATISISFVGNLNELYFYNIANGEIAYRAIKQIVNNNKIN